MYSELLKKAIEIQNNKPLGIAKDEKDYAFTFIYPPSQVLYDLKDNAFDNKTIESANLYLHIPYCTGKCTYCYFGCYSLSSAPYNKCVYIENMCKEMEIIHKHYGRIKLASIHFGGGTPTTLNEKEIQFIFTNIRKFFDVDNNIEITFESSPETITGSKLKVLLDNGVNRLNIGIQTLNDKLLNSINRRHDSKKALESISLAQDLGLNNINVDLMYGLNGQTMNDWINTISTILKTKVQSISTYRLRLHPNGKIRKDIYSFDEIKAIEMYVNMMEMMDSYKYYQCSSHKFAIKEEFAQKQIINKRGVDNNTLLPIGMAAYGYIDNVLFWNERTMNAYMDKVDKELLPFSIGYILDKTEQIAKSCVLGIHNVNGLDLQKYTRKFKENLQYRYGDLLESLTAYNLIEINHKSMKLSKLGMIFADEIATMFYSENIKQKLNTINKKYGIFFDQIID